MIYLRASFSDMLPDDYSIFVTFQYNPNYVQIIKSLPKRAWNDVAKHWEVSYDCYNQLISTLNNYGIPYNANEFMLSIQQLQKAVQKIQEQQQEQQKLDVTILDNVEFKTNPYSYQKEGIAYGLSHDKFLLADEPGLGKSMQSANIARLKRGGKHCLIVVGYKSLLFNWAAEIEQHTNEKAYVIGQRIKKKTDTLVTGNIKERLEDLQNLDKIEEFFLITDITTLRQCEKIEKPNKDNKKKKKDYYKIFYFADLIEQHCRNGNIGRIILDESHVFKNFDVDQTQALLKLKTCPYKIAMTGTPVMNRNQDLYPIMYWLGQERRNYWQFRDRYCVMGGFKGKQVIGNKNNDELHSRLSQFMLRRKKSDVLDLPEKIYIKEYLEMDGKQWALYQKMQALLKKDFAQMKGNKVKMLAGLLNLRKVTCHPGWIDPSFEDSVKYERARQIVFEAVENGQKTIIFSNFTTPFESDIHAVNLYEQLKMYNPALIVGNTKDRMAEVNKFQNDPSCMVIVGSIGAMGVGLTLHAASNVIFMDDPWNMALKKQAEDRANRVGSKFNLNVYTLMCKDTFDVKINNLVEKKGRVADEIVDGITTQELEELLENNL